MALLCIVLSLGLAMAQAAHSHMTPLRNARHTLRLQATLSAAPELCPLCTGMHPYSPAAAPVLMRAPLAYRPGSHAAPVHRSAADLPFPLSGRPPPSAMTL